MRIVDNFIGGQHRASASTRLGNIFNPATGQVQAQVHLSAPSELDEAIANAQAAQPAWAAMNPQRRARVMFNLKALIEQHMDELAELLSVEHGKVHSDAKGDIQRGLDVVEFACGIPHLLKGEYTEGAGPGIDVYSLRQPIGIAAGITPFNFPAMIPMWMFAPAIACGNAFILKPSERNPSVPVRLAELAMEAGLPAGILNVVHGDKQVVDAILDHPAIKAVSFVGSSDIAQYVYGRGASNGKRMQCMGGAKNHGIVMPDADLDQAVADILGAAYGSAGERCMALPVVVPVGEQTAVALRAKLEAGIAGLRVGVPSDPDAHYGPVVSAAHKARIENYIQMAVDEGSELVIDGRGFALQGYEDGFFLAPTLLDRVTYRYDAANQLLEIGYPSGLAIVMAACQPWSRRQLPWQMQDMSVSQLQVARHWPLGPHDHLLLETLLAAADMPADVKALAQAMRDSGRKAEQEGWL